MEETEYSFIPNLLWFFPDKNTFFLINLIIHLGLVLTEIIYFSFTPKSYYY